MNQRKQPVNPVSKKPTRYIIGHSPENKFRRDNLMTNASRGLGKIEQKGKHLSYIVGNDEDGYIEYLILHTTIEQLNDF